MRQAAWSLPIFIAASFAGATDIPSLPPVKALSVAILRHDARPAIKMYGLFNHADQIICRSAANPYRVLAGDPSANVDVTRWNSASDAELARCPVAVVWADARRTPTVRAQACLGDSAARARVLKIAAVCEGATLP